MRNARAEKFEALLSSRFGACIQLWFTPSVHKCAFDSRRNRYLARTQNIDFASEIIMIIIIIIMIIIIIINK